MMRDGQKILRKIRSKKIKKICLRHHHRHMDMECHGYKWPMPGKVGLDKLGVFVRNWGLVKAMDKKDKDKNYNQGK
jgi:hypothetical protein